MSLPQSEVQKASREFCRAVEELGPLERWDRIMRTLKGHASLQCQREEEEYEPGVS